MTRSRVAGLVISLVALLTNAASATEGYFQQGYGARQKALAGAGVADGRDATSAALNPAGILRAANEIDVSATIFNPSRQFEGTGGPGFTPNGVVESDRNFFVVPNIAANWKTSGLFDAIALTMYGNGGMNTTYRGTVGGPGCPGAGVFCGGPAGVDLQQMMISIAGAKRFGNVSVGIAPILAVQMFEAKGLGSFAAFGASSDPANLTNRGRDIAIGGGLRAGIEVAVASNIRVGIAGNTPIWSQKFDKYRGLFAEQGGFDIPASVQAGIAVDLSPAVTVMLDYKHIWYSGTASVSNRSANLLSGNLMGSSNGPGFGWRDVDVLKFGVEWKATTDLTLRGGYSYNTQPVRGADAMLNILAPGVTQHHFNAGLMYKLSPSMDLELAGMYAPRTHVRGGELPLMGPNTHQIDLSMRQIEVTAGIKYKFAP